MKVGKFTAVFLSVVFFVIVASVTAISIGSLFPSFSFSDNWFVRIVLLFITFIIARKFYDFIYGDVEVKEGKNKVAVYSDEDNKRKNSCIWDSIGFYNRYSLHFCGCIVLIRH